MISGLKMDMNSEMERWALCRAQEIVVKEGFMLIDAAQALDKKRTKTGVHRLQQAIGQAILLAMEEFATSSTGAAVASRRPSRQATIRASADAIPAR